MYNLQQLAVFVLLTSSACFCATSRDKPKNVVIILADDLGWDDVSFHGVGQIPTPNIDVLASSGMILHNYYVSPICSPSRAALLTGLHPIHTGMQVGVIAAPEPYGLPTQFQTLGDYFRQAGFATHLVGKWHQGFYRAQHLPTRRGFDTFFGYLTAHSDYFNRTDIERSFSGLDLYENETRADLEQYRGQYSTDLYTDRVESIIRAHASNESSQPFLLYFAQQSVHAGEDLNPIEPPPKYADHFKHIANADRRRFAGMVAALDDSVGRVFKALNDTGLLDETIIMFSTDNGGTNEGKSGRQTYDSMGSNFPLKGAKYTLWEGGVRGTAFLWSRDLANQSTHVNHQLMHITDLLPTLYRAATGTKLEANIDGLDLWNSVTSGEKIDRVLLHNIDNTYGFWALRWQDLKLTFGTSYRGEWDWWYQAPGETTEKPESICYNCSDAYKVLMDRNISVEPISLGIVCPPQGVQCNGTGLCLFDLAQDPCEGNNIVATRPEVVTKLLDHLDRFNRTYATPCNQPEDAQADPALHGGFWSPWM